MARNRIRCLDCGSEVESVARNDLQMCDCGSCGVDGGTDYYKLLYKDIKKIRRIADDDSEIEIREQGEVMEVENEMPSEKRTKEELLKSLDLVIETFKSLPQNAMMAPMTHYDYYSLLILMRDLFAEQ